MLLPQDLAAEQWAQLMTIVQSEMNAGGRLAVQSVPLKDVRKSAHFWTESVPAAGIQLQRVSEAKYATRAHMVTTDFLIVVAANSVDVVNGTTKTPANLDAAMAVLQPLISDGSGNGFAPILRDPANYFLGGNASETGISSIDYQWDIGPGKTPQIWAYAYIQFHAKQIVAI